jgi:hypothetical protein
MNTTNVFFIARKVLAAGIVLAILLNGLLPKSLLGYRDCGEMEQVIRTQSVLFTQIQSLTGFAVKIAGFLLRCSFPRAAVPSSGGGDDAKNTSSDYSLMSVAKRLGSLSWAAGVAVVVSVAGVAGGQVAGAGERFEYDGDRQGVYLLLLLCLFGLVRRAVFDRGTERKEYMCPTCFDKPGFLFYKGRLLIDTRKAGVRTW